MHFALFSESGDAHFVAYTISCIFESELEFFLHYLTILNFKVNFSFCRVFFFSFLKILNPNNYK